MKKILIIEDDKIVAGIYQNKFSAEGWQTESAPDGEIGLLKVKKFRPDLLVLDLMLPKLNGVEVIKRLRKDPEFTTLPIIVLSNSYVPQVVQDAWRAGANKCLSKSECTPKVMVELIWPILMAIPEPAPVVVEPPPPVAPPPPTSPVLTNSGSVAEMTFQENLQAGFLAESVQMIGRMRAQMLAITKSSGDARVAGLRELYQWTCTFTGSAAVVGLTTAARMSSAFEAFVREMLDKPESINPSSIRTLAQTIDFLADLVKYVDPAQEEAVELPSPAILVVDDEPISRRAIVFALEKASLKCISLPDPEMALGMLRDNRFDLVFLDVDMPGMNGFELCKTLRQIEGYEKTPVVFVTGLTDFESRAQSTLSGGNDLIGKPFAFMELAVKALMYILKTQVLLRRNGG